MGKGERTSFPEALIGRPAARTDAPEPGFGVSVGPAFRGQRRDDTEEAWTMLHDECLTCLSNQGVRRISPGPTLYEGTHWLVEHGYPAALTGWLVIALKRHVEALHEVTTEEFAELGGILSRTCALLRAELGCEKEYVACLSELERFKHIHFHVVARPAGIPESLSGKQLLLTLRSTPGDAADPHAIVAFCERMRSRFHAEELCPVGDPSC